MPQWTLDEIEVAALTLPEWDRLHVAEILLASLDNDEQVREAWAAQAQRRLADSRMREPR
jgi:hypothetical protein